MIAAINYQEIRYHSQQQKKKKKLSYESFIFDDNFQIPMK